MSTGRLGAGRRGAVAAVAVAAAAVIPGACGQPGGGGDALADRRAGVAERGATVMPFDLDATTHVFEPRGDGLEQRVVADDPGDTGQVALVREHLAHEAACFAEGDFGDPATIHGEDMPGLAELEAGHARIEVRYRDLPDGGRILYTTGDPDLVDALHDWADAQVSDHGAHAEHGTHAEHGGEAEHGGDAEHGDA